MLWFWLGVLFERNRNDGVSNAGICWEAPQGKIDVHSKLWRMNILRERFLFSVDVNFTESGFRLGRTTAEGLNPGYGFVYFSELTRSGLRRITDQPIPVFNPLRVMLPANVEVALVPRARDGVLEAFELFFPKSE